MCCAEKVSWHSWIGGLILGEKVRIARNGEVRKGWLTLLKTLAKFRICSYKICC